MTEPHVRVATPSQTVGPFFHIGVKGVPRGSMLPLGVGERIRLRIVVTDGDGSPVPDALVELWVDNGEPLAAFARMATSADGGCEFDAVRPPAPGDPAPPHAAPHINVCLFARGLLRQLHTRLYFAGDRLDDDPVLALVPEDRRRTLLAMPDEAHPGWVFRLRLQGADETVFFDV